MKSLKAIAKWAGLLLLLLIIIGAIYQRDLLQRLLATGSSHPFSQLEECGKDTVLMIRSHDPAVKLHLAKADEKIRQLQKKFSIPGLNICVARSGAIIWNEAFGCSNMEEKVAAKVFDGYRIGSISKSITAIALMKLVQEGKLDWDQTIQYYLAGQVPIKAPITLRQLASHQSGIRHYKGLEMFSNRKYSNNRETLQVFLNDPLAFNPGSDFQYSSYGYSLLAAVLEEKTGMSLIEYLGLHILAPLKMEDTRIEFDGEYRKFYSSSPASAKIKRAVQVNTSNKLAGGGLISTSRDLVSMLVHLDSILSPALQKQLFTPQPLTDGTMNPQNYALGFRVDKTGKSNRTLIHHGGSSVGGRSFLLKVVEEDLIIAICTNNDTGMLRPHHFGIQEVYDIAKVFFD